MQRLITSDSMNELTTLLYLIYRHIMRIANIPA
nr:MAG TPA: hypothetical protein [Caudoviricetes sp.]